MIYNLSTLQTNLFGLVGFRQSLETEFAILTAENIATSSGLYFNDFHPLITTETIKNILPPTLSTANLNTELSSMVKGSIAKVILEVIQKKKPQVKDLIQKMYLFDNEPEMANLIDNNNYFVGYEFDLAKNNNIKVTINSIGTQFDGIKTFTIYLYHSSQATAIASKEVTTVLDNSTFTDLTTFIMTYLSDNYVGGKYYIGYKQSDLGSVQAIGRGFEDSGTQNATKYVGIKPIYVDTYSGVELPPLGDIKDSTYTHGLNFEITVSSDFTSFISDNKNMFANLIGYQFAYDMLERIINSTRNNAIKKETRSYAFAELHGTDANREIGLSWRLQQAIKESEFDLSSIDSMFLPARDRFSFAGL